MKAMSAIYGGLLVAIFGVIFLVGSTGFDMGTPRNMGPGMFPIVLSILTIVVGFAVAVGDLVSGNTPQGPFPWRPLFTVGTVIALFALLIEPAGIAVTTMLAIGLMGFFVSRMKPVETLLLGVGLALFLWVVFVLGLGMPLNFLPEAIQ
ncbi:tripartite tricarboxylate transporter TctB family protein [Sinisalibacter aestuarii]|uniref:DUF1468 domain-containing protein n=1 Tax=Sinisalibacter aestuarii TaxID=2949426 RepID=A0ABQ5LYH7_9RHOB|nr:tripartite tricarboxylate transporter TctB family protein [Sinisalibacter aestuarii]GKY89848.1 hypothetical protein STA1M1_37170 [Sinisalibacter aestuarii]